MFEEKHPYYHTCPLCGANLDPNENCDCQDDKVTEKSEESEVKNTYECRDKRYPIRDTGGHYGRSIQ
jgi:hypothetical protein